MASLAFVILASYGIARPGIESLFLSRFDEGDLPWAWLATAGVTAISTWIYVRFAGRTSLVRVFCGAGLLAASLLVGLLLAVPSAGSAAVFALYVWKDVYIVILIEMFWTLANTRSETKTARWVYGLYSMAGSFGAIAGNRIIKLGSVELGTVDTLWAVLPVLAIAVVGFAALGGTVARPVDESLRAGAGGWTEGVGVMRASHYLGLMLLLILTTQLVINFIDYQFSGFMKDAFPDTDQRTAVGADIYTAINLCSVALQVLTGPVLRFIGLATVLLAIPLILGASVAVFAVTGGLSAMVVTKVASKAFDYSLFRAAKEMLYIPLSYAEKTQGKAFVDMMTYRVAKGGASLLVLGLEAVKLTAVVGLMNLGWIAAWIALTVPIVRRYRARVGVEAASDGATV